MKQGIIIDSPFGLYTLADCKKDTAINLIDRRFIRTFREAKNEAPFTIISLLLLTGWISLLAYATAT